MYLCLCLHWCASHHFATQMPEYEDKFSSNQGAASESIAADDGGVASALPTFAKDTELSKIHRAVARKFSPDDEAAIEAAVEIALLLSHSSQKNAEILVKTVLTDNFNLLSSTAATIRAETLSGPHK